MDVRLLLPHYPYLFKFVFPAPERGITKKIQKYEEKETHSCLTFYQIEVNARLA
jgi:hypothetical protein